MADKCKICNEDMGYSGTNCALSSTFKGLVCYKCLEKPEVNSKLIIPAVTKLENDVIMNGIAKSDFFDDYTDETRPPDLFDDFTNGFVWLIDLLVNCEITIPVQLPGVVSSLVKKGLVSSEGAGGDATVQLTIEGYWYYLNNRGD